MAGSCIPLGEWVDRDARCYTVSINDYSEVRPGGRDRMGYKLHAYPVDETGGPVVIDLYGSHLDFLYHRLAWEVPDSDRYRDELLNAFIEGCRRAVFMRSVSGTTEIGLSNQPDNPLGLYCEQPKMSDIPVFLLQEDPDFEPELAKYARAAILRYLRPAYLSGKSYGGIYQVVAGPGSTDLADSQAEWLVKKGYAEHRTTEHEVSRSLGITDEGLDYLQRLETDLSRGVPEYRTESTDRDQRYDCFVCHASEDKKTFVDALSCELRDSGCTVWYDDFILKVGDSLQGKIDEGLARSRYGIVVLSPNFFSVKKHWPRKELDGLAAMARKRGILPVYLDMRVEDVVQHSPTLAGTLAADAREGLGIVVRKLLEAMEKPVPERLTMAESESHGAARGAGGGTQPRRIELEGVLYADCSVRLSGCTSPAGSQNIVKLARDADTGEQVNVCERCLQRKLESGQWVGVS